MSKRIEAGEVVVGDFIRTPEGASFFEVKRVWIKREADPEEDRVVLDVGWGTVVLRETAFVDRQDGAEAGVEAECPNCLCAHGTFDACALGVLAAVVEARWAGDEDFPPITGAMLGAVDADVFWSVVAPAVDWLEDELRRASAR